VGGGSGGLAGRGVRSSQSKKVHPWGSSTVTAAVYCHYVRGRHRVYMSLFLPL